MFDRNGLRILLLEIVTMLTWGSMQLGFRLKQILDKDYKKFFHFKVVESETKKFTRFSLNCD